PPLVRESFLAPIPRRWCENPFSHPFPAGIPSREIINSLNGLRPRIETGVAAVALQNLASSPSLPLALSPTLPLRVANQNTPAGRATGQGPCVLLRTLVVKRDGMLMPGDAASAGRPGPAGSAWPARAPR